MAAVLCGDFSFSVRPIVVIYLFIFFPYLIVEKVAFRGLVTFELVWLISGGVDASYFFFFF